MLRRRESRRISMFLLELTVGHGGWSEFRICPNNDVNKAVTQQCLDQHLLATTGGETRIRIPHVARKFRMQFKLPAGLTCSQCVLQWKWNTGEYFPFNMTSFRHYWRTYIKERRILF